MSLVVSVPCDIIISEAPSVTFNGVKFLSSEPRKVSPADLYDFMSDAVTMRVYGPWEEAADGGNIRVRRDVNGIPAVWIGEAMLEPRGYYIAPVGSAGARYPSVREAQAAGDAEMMKWSDVVIVDPVFPECGCCDSIVPDSFTAVVS